MSRFNLAPEKALSAEEKKRVYGIIPDTLLEKIFAVVSVIAARLVEPHLEALEAKVAKPLIDAHWVASQVHTWLADNPNFIAAVAAAVAERLPAPPPAAAEEVIEVKVSEETPPAEMTIDPLGLDEEEVTVVEVPEEILVEEIPEETGQPESTPEPTTASAAEAAPPAPAALTIFQMAEKTKKADEDWQGKKNAAREALFNALCDLKVRLDPDAVCHDRDKTAFFFLTVQIAKGEMTVEQAVKFAKSQKGWLVELAVDPRVHRAMIEAFTEAGLWLDQFAHIDGQKVDVQTKLGESLEKGEITLEQAIEIACDGRWARPMSEKPYNIGDALRDKEAAETEEDERRKNNGGGKHRRERGRTGEGSRKV